MGYCAHINDEHFRIEASSLTNLHAHMRAWRGPGPDHYGWFDMDQFNTGRNGTINDMAVAFGFQFTHDDDGNIDFVEFLADKPGEDDALFFALIAPFVTAGSWVEWYGEDGAIWRWAFDGKRAFQQEPRIEYDPIPTGADA